MIKRISSLATGMLILFSVPFASAIPITTETDPLLAGSTLIDFEAPTAGNYLSLDLGGVTVNGLGAPMTICTNCGGGSGLFGDTGQSLNNTSGSPFSFELVFDNVVSAFGIVAGAANSDWTWTAYDEFDNVIESVILGEQSPGFEGEFLGIGAQGIKRVLFEPDFTDWLVLDDLRFVSQVPEPSTLGLLGLGLLGLGFARRKRA